MRNLENILNDVIIIMVHGGHIHQVQREDIRDVGTLVRSQWPVNTTGDEGLLELKCNVIGPCAIV